MTPPGEKRSGQESERFMILQMVQDGTISLDEGARLLEAMDRAERTVAIPPVPPVPPKPKDVRILVTSNTGENEIDLVLPLPMVEMGLNLARRFAPDRIPDMTEIRRSIQSGFTGTLMNIENGKSHIQIIIQERN